MSDQNSPNAELRKDVDTIREILFGENLQIFEKRIRSLEDTVAGLQAENSKLRETLAADAEAHEQLLRRLGEVQDQVQHELGALQSELHSQAKADRESHQKAVNKLNDALSGELSQVYERLEDQLDAHRQLQDELVESLAAALVSYQQNSPKFEAAD